jgi:Tannase-like family of unknown function (DUF6351)
VDSVPGQYFIGFALRVPRARVIALALANGGHVCKSVRIAMRVCDAAKAHFAIGEALDQRETRMESASLKKATAACRVFVLVSALTTAISLPAQATGGGREGDDHEVQIETLSTRPFAVSGGDVLIEVKAPWYLRADDLVIRLNGKDVSDAFSAKGRRLTGLVTGLSDGRNTLTVGAKFHHHNVYFRKLEITNHPTSGEILGAHQRPWICETAAAGLGAPPASGPCAAPTKYEWFYRTTAGAFAPLPNATPPFPADLAQTTTIDGETVNYIVRVESGVIDESIYRIAIIDDPTNPISNPWSKNGKRPGKGWNGKLTWPFGGGCGPGYRSGSNTAQSALQDTPLKLGFAVAFGTRNTLGTGCNDVVSAETMMMIKERFIEQYGVPKFTIGSGGSGGSMQQRLIVQNYPGLLDAITPGISYADLVSILPDVADCGLLNNYFDNVANAGSWPASRRAEVDGYPVNAAGTNTTCRSWNGFARSWTSSTLGFSAVVPAELRYDPATNPNGARGSFWDGNINSFGKDPTTGFARSAYDNVGVQYGLKALNSGAITVDEFLDLNEKIGGYDFDGNIIPDRSRADRTALRNTYRTGRLTSGENQIVPTIDTRIYTDATIDIHTRIRTFAMLERLLKQNGTTANQVNWLTPAGAGAFPNIAELALRAHNEWLENILADTAHDSYARKVIRNKPQWVKDACWEADGTKHEEAFTLDESATCNRIFPIYATVRLQAGSPLSSDIMKCHLKPANGNDYKVAFTDAQRSRLKTIFPQGVCDWGKRGVEQQPIRDTWLTYPAPGFSVSIERGGHRAD